MTLFDFNKDSNISDWKVMDDVVMGGKSSGHFKLTEEGHGLFYGKVSLENYGGFSSVRYRFESKDIDGFSKVKIRCKGDGKRYQFRVKTDAYDEFSYIQHFQTSGEWETIVLNLADSYPTFRGRKLDMPNYPAKNVEEVAFLIGNKLAESFELEIDYVVFEH